MQLLSLAHRHQDKGLLFPLLGSSITHQGWACPSSKGSPKIRAREGASRALLVALALQLSPAALMVCVNKGWISPPTPLVFCPLQNTFFSGGKTPML